MMENIPPVVSVVISTCNRAHLLKDTIGSVLHQDYPHWELDIINDCSEDDTAELLESLSDPRIHYENLRSHGTISAARNRGIRRARGEFIAFLDDDDIWYPHKLSTCVGAMAEGIDAVCHGMHARQDGILTKALVPPPLGRDLYSTLLFRGNTFLITSAVMIRKDCLARVGGFDDGIISNEDYDLWLRLARQGARFLLLREVLGEYRVHREGHSQNILRGSNYEAEVVSREFRRIPDDSLSMVIRKRRRMALIYLQASRRFQRAGMYREAALALLKAFRALVR